MGEVHRMRPWRDVVAELEAQHRAQRGPRWHLVQLAPGEREKRTAPPAPEDDAPIVDLIRRLGFGIYCPMLRVLTSVPRRSMTRTDRKAGVKLMTERREPLLPRYRFVQFDPAEGRWSELARIAGVAGIATDRGQPVPISDALIAAMRAAEKDGAIPGTLPAQTVFKLGNVIRVADPESPWAYMMGPIEHIRERTIDGVDVADRLTITLHLFGRFTPVELEPNQVEPI